MRQAKAETIAAKDGVPHHQPSYSRTAGFGLATTVGIAMSLLLSTHARGNSAPSNKETTRYIDARATSSGSNICCFVILQNDVQRNTRASVFVSTLSSQLETYSEFLRLMTAAATPIKRHTARYPNQFPPGNKYHAIPVRSAEMRTPTRQYLLFGA